MTPAPLPTDEAQRLSALQALDVLDTAPEQAFDALVEAAALVCGAPIALLSLIDADRQWWKAAVGLASGGSTPREFAFCGHAILDDALFVVPDARADPRFADNPLVTDAPAIRFYAGAPLRLADGARVGTLCVIDQQPRSLGARQREVLAHLATAAVKALEGRRALAQERAARAAERRAAVVLAHSADAVIALDLNACITLWNPAAERLLGYPAGQVLGQPLAQLRRLPGREPLGPQRLAELLRAHPDGTRYRTEILHADGEPVAVSVSLAAIPGADGRPDGATLIVRDVREQTRATEALAAALERMAVATDSGGIGIWEYEPAAGTLRWDDWMRRLFGRPGPAGLVVTSVWRESLHPEDREGAVARLARVLADPAQADYQDEFRVQHPDGSVHHLRAAARISRDAQGRALRMVGANWDVTPLRRLSAELAEQHELLRTTLQSIGDAVITTGPDGRVDWLNPAAERLTGWTSGEAHGQPLARVYRTVDERSRAPLPPPAARAPGAATAAPALLLSRRGAEHGVEDSVAPIRNARGEQLGTVLVFRDVTEQRRLAGEMTWRATHDTLTGMVNRGEFESRLRQLLAQSRQDERQHALMLIDLDQFKLVNDACGHAVGDQLLQQVARLLQQHVRAGDTVARLGGDEFGVILAGCPLEPAQRIAQQICDRMEDFRFVHEARRFRVGASVGLVPVDARWAGTAPLLQAADAACFAAKEGGRNRVHAWQDTDLAVRARHGEMRWATRLEQALDEDRFALHAQRIVPLRADAPAGLHAEVLLRMVDTDGSLVPPGAFLPAAERFHFAPRIDRWVLRQTIATLRALPDLRGVALLSVNLSGQSVGDRAFHRMAIGKLQEAGPAVCRRLCLEITETTAITGLADAAAFIAQARALGVRIALDDFGAGASSFGYLKSLAVDLLKIDGQFIRDLITDPLDDAAVRCFVDVARVIGVQTVAEFVDQPAVLERLQAIGIDHAQGYLLHRPEPIASVLAAAAASTA